MGLVIILRRPESRCIEVRRFAGAEDDLRGHAVRSSATWRLAAWPEAAARRAEGRDPDDMFHRAYDLIVHDGVPDGAGIGITDV